MTRLADRAFASICAKISASDALPAPPSLQGASGPSLPARLSPPSAAHEEEEALPFNHSDVCLEAKDTLADRFR